MEVMVLSFPLPGLGRGQTWALCSFLSNELNIAGFILEPTQWQIEIFVLYLHVTSSCLEDGDSPITVVVISFRVFLSISFTSQELGTQFNNNCGFNKNKKLQNSSQVDFNLVFQFIF